MDRYAPHDPLVRYSHQTQFGYTWQSLLKEPFRSRRKFLCTYLSALRPDQNGAARFEHVESCESEEGRNAIEEFWFRAVDSRCEGLMIKVREYVSISFSRPTLSQYFKASRSW